MMNLNVFSVTKVLQMATKFELASKLLWEMMLYVFIYIFLSIRCMINTAVTVNDNPSSSNLSQGLCDDH